VPTALSPRAREALTAGNLAHLVTLNPNGTPQVTLVWVGLGGDEIVSAHLGAWQKVKNVRRDPRVSLSMETGGKNEYGFDHYLTVHGRAYVTEGGAPELLQRLAYTYIGPGVKFPPMDNPAPGYILHIVPERVGGNGPWHQEAE
jgi:PPOX class probable F420-dependent enzyme